MRVLFVLPGRSRVPVGGFKVVYEYANHLVARGHDVAVVHPWQVASSLSWRERLRARRWASRLGRDRAEIVPWFELDPRVELPLPDCLAAERLPAADAIVATAWQTAAPVAAASGPGGPRGYYLIQHFEPWDDQERVLETWRLPLHKIVIARWLEEIADSIGEGERTTWVPNGLDFSRLGVDLPPADREPRVGALISPFKGAEDTYAALHAAREGLPELRAGCYGTRERPAELPEWARYERLPDPGALRGLYNSCSIFLQSSHSEGWGLPATEAMACGCALVTYDNGGSREYAIDGETAVVVTEREPALLAEAIVGLARDRERRLALARRGRELVEGFTWERAVERLEAVLGTPPGADVGGA